MWASESLLLPFPIQHLTFSKVSLPTVEFSPLQLNAARNSLCSFDVLSFHFTLNLVLKQRWASCALLYTVVLRNSGGDLGALVVLSLRDLTFFPLMLWV